MRRSVSTLYSSFTNIRFKITQLPNMEKQNMSLKYELCLDCSALDGSVLDGGKPVCECNACHTGPDCSQLVPDCVWKPMFLEPFWKQNAANSAIMVAGWLQMGYEFEDGSLTSNELEKVIRKLHATVGNAVTDGGYIVFGAGLTQLLNAAVHALSSDGSSSPAMVTAMLRGSNAKQIHDLAYYWPHYTAIPSPMDEDLMIFTFSKLTDHAGSRFWWAIVKDRVVYERMVNYVDLNTYGALEKLN
ncbi:unnamed protein product [Coffea canephora]|uniref:Alliinase C-terminal domain-containing protein n=1 Tax=Coffea canephora TaxID=49390 RepID=A0A068UUY3_COFCA|nr:unnamed protein product [Coffea canephora]